MPLTSLSSSAAHASPPPRLVHAESACLWPRWALGLLLALLVAAPASTKVAGAAWLLVVLTGLWACLRLPVARSLTHPLVQSSRLWFFACLVAMALQAAATLYWADPWGDRHVEIRLLLAAGATLALMRRLRLLPHQKRWLIHCLALACCVALGVTVIHGRMTPTNAIPWAAGVSFLVCVLMPYVLLQPQTARWQRTAWACGVLAGMAAVLLSLSRGSYGLVLWVLCVAGVAIVQHLLRQRHAQRSGYSIKKNSAFWLAGTAALLALATVLLLGFPHDDQAPAGRVQDAWSEMEESSRAELPQAQVINTSVGARLHMWRMALKEVAKAPWLGHGRKARIAWIRQLGETDGSDTIKTLTHLHSDPLTSLFDHGFLGLSSYLVLGAGLAWLATRRQCCNAGLRWSLGGILWMHLTSGLTNMNLGHNYYGVMLALSLSVAWLLSSDDAADLAAGPAQT